MFGDEVDGRCRRHEVYARAVLLNDCRRGQGVDPQLLSAEVSSLLVETLRVRPSTARRFILGRQGLWPGRRWTRAMGLARVLREIGSVQVDPLEVVGRSQDLALSSRVVGYRPPDLERTLYRERTLFEWGGGLVIRPVEEFPYLIHRMQEFEHHPKWENFGRTQRALVDRVLRAVEERGPLGSRDLPEGAKVESYRASRDTGLALYYLWLTGRLVIHHREKGERVYDLTTRCIPRRFLRAVPAPAAREYLVARAMDRWGLPNRSEVHSALHWAHPDGHSPKVTREWIATRERKGDLVRVEVEGQPQPQWTTPEGAEQLSRLERDLVPAGWNARSATSEEEAVFLAPLDVVIRDTRARRFFGFQYRWEVYVPAAKRKWGYYTLPILYGDALRARADLRFDRDSETLRVLGFWLEENNDAGDANLAAAIGRGLARLRDMVGAQRVDLTKMTPRAFAAGVRSAT